MVDVKVPCLVAIPSSGEMPRSASNNDRNFETIWSGVGFFLKLTLRKPPSNTFGFWQIGHRSTCNRWVYMYMYTRRSICMHRYVVCTCIRREVARRPILPSLASEKSESEIQTSSVPPPTTLMTTTTTLMLTRTLKRMEGVPPAERRRIYCKLYGSRRRE